MEKRCTKCGETKPFSEFHKNARSKDGLQSRCKPCHTASVRESVLNYPDRVRDYLAKHRVLPQAKEGQRIRYARWKAKRLASDPEALRRMEAEKAARYRQRNPEREKASRLKWNAANPGKVNEHNHRARAQQIGVVNYREIIERDKSACYLCGLPVDITLPKADPMSKHFDHVIPLSKGGPYSMENIRLTHARCNYRKAARLHEAGQNY